MSKSTFEAPAFGSFGFRIFLTMPTFTYKAIAADGSVAEGQIPPTRASAFAKATARHVGATRDAGNRPDAFRVMETRGLRPVSLSEAASLRPGGATREWGQLCKL